MMRHVSEQRGLTLVELMVAMAISLLIALVAMAALLASRQGFTAVDAASQLRDNGRFAADVIERLAVQSGFKDTLFAATVAPAVNAPVAGIEQNPAPNILGFNNAVMSSVNPLSASTARTAGDGGNGSDVLVLRFQPVETYSESGVYDGSMIDCAGNSPTNVPANRARYDRMASVLHVAMSQGEPSLMCTYWDAGTSTYLTQPLIQGVEDFQVLYGTDGVTANTASAEATSSGTPTSYLRADQLTVAGNSVGTNNNWRRVRSLRIGMVLVGARNSAQERVIQDLFPFGVAKESDDGDLGSAMASDDDAGTTFSAPADGRLRQVLTFTVHLRNDQGR